jgi:threonine/homoserine/homoserine lactone efflux protein
LDPGFFIKGFIIGLSISAPMGPVAVFCLQRTLNKGLWIGFISGLGAALADTFYASIAIFGLSFISDFISENQHYLLAGGGILLIMIGIKVFYTNTVKQVRMQKVSKRRLVGDVFSGFFLTISNPLAILFFGAVFAGLGLISPEENSVYNFMTIGGVLLGAVSWWAILATVVNLFRNRIRLRSLWWINKIAGGMIAILGIVAVISLFFMERFI